ncbi:phenylalanine--tRNA ligase subunit alpha [Candidatus Woesearchaeota archaeon]|nr:phenylalanine--tRNA ligase subunit alpha [Candidatus Woesearchaeota archaeon]
MEENKITSTLHPLERKILPLLSKCKTLKELVEASKLKEVEVMRALQWLSNKNIVKIHIKPKETVELDENGLAYVKAGLPERRFLEAIKTKALHLDAIAKNAKLVREEVNACIGSLRKKAAIEITPDKKIKLTEPGKKILLKESLEEKFLKKLSKKPINIKELNTEEKFALQNFLKRKQIIKQVLEKLRETELTDLGKKVIKIKIKTSSDIERVTPELLKTGKWKNKQFRKYDVKADVPALNRGKRHFVNQATDYARQIWVELGFKEMTGPILNTSFWNFDALFTAQDHPVRELQDTFYIKHPAKGKLPPKKLVENVKATHEHGWNLGSTGWQYSWNPEDAKKNVLRTHTTVLSAQTLAALKTEDLPAKFFAVGKCFRNETLDWSHLFEFNQFEGIVVDPDANFKHLLGYLKNFLTKIGFPKARFRPAYFPYTEMSTEIDVFHPVHKKWYELGGAGILRPEVVVPLLGKDIPVLAWGPGLDRQMTEFYKIDDLRELYKNDLKQLREMKEWML